MHPVYGGWFAFRSVIVLPGLELPSLTKVEPIDIVPSQKGRVELLTLFNKHWQDNRFRDVVHPEQRYSEIQREYFNKPPKERKIVIDRILNGDY